MNCPHCKVPLMMTDRKGIEIDYCGQCRGVWLDRGELDKIIELSVSNYRGQNSRIEGGSLGYVSHSSHHSPSSHSGWHDVINQRKHQNKYHQPYYKYRKKKSLLGDLFDIFD